MVGQRAADPTQHSRVEGRVASLQNSRASSTPNHKHSSTYTADRDGSFYNMVPGIPGAPLLVRRGPPGAPPSAYALSAGFLNNFPFPSLRVSYGRFFVGAGVSATRVKKTHTREYPATPSHTSLVPHTHVVRANADYCLKKSEPKQCAFPLSRGIRHVLIDLPATALDETCKTTNTTNMILLLVLLHTPVLKK